MGGGGGGGGGGGSNSSSSSSSFAVWLGHELGAMGGDVSGELGGGPDSSVSPNRAGPTRAHRGVVGVGAGGGLAGGIGAARLSQILRCALAVTCGEACAPLRHASIELIEAVLLCPAVTTLGSRELGRAICVTVSQLDAADAACCALARRGVAAAPSPSSRSARTPPVMMHLHSHRRGDHDICPRQAGGVSSLDASRACQRSDRRGANRLARPRLTSAWRHHVARSAAPVAYGPLQLQRTLRLLSGRAPLPLAPPPLARANHAASHARLLVTCGSSQPAALRSMVAAEPQLGAWWSAFEASRFLVNSRLRSPYGGPAQTFEGLERMLSSALPPSLTSSAVVRRSPAVARLRHRHHQHRRRRPPRLRSRRRPPLPRIRRSSDSGCCSTVWSISSGTLSTHTTARWRCRRRRVRPGSSSSTTSAFASNGSRGCGRGSSPPRSRRASRRRSCATRSCASPS